MEKTPTFSIQSFGNYHLLERIAVGGMAEIFKAKQTGVRGFEKILVIKKILQHLSEDPEFVEMFEDEAKIAAQLTQANIVQIFELGEIGGTLYITMEYVDGKNLRDITRNCSQRGIHLSVEQCVFLMTEVLKGLDYAHRKPDSSGQPMQIIHRDISPQNIIVSYEGEVKILDFGIAKAASRISKTEAGVLKGKFSYMSPEQASGKIVDQRTDIYACGVIFHELLTSDRLFRAKTDLETLDRVKEGIVHPPSEKNMMVPAELDAIVLKSLAKEPVARYTTAGEMLNDLGKLNSLRFTSQDLATFMKTLFASTILEERERLMSALARVPVVVSPNEQILNARTHIAFKRQPTESALSGQTAGEQQEEHTFSASHRLSPRKLRARKIFGVGLVGAILLIVLLIRFDSHRQSAPTDAQHSIDPTPLAQPSATGMPEIVPIHSPVEFPESSGKVDEVFGEVSPPAESENVQRPTATPLPRIPPKPRSTPKPTPAPPRVRDKGSIDMMAPAEGFAQLYIDGKHYGTVPGPKARGIELEEGTHMIKCEANKKTYAGRVEVKARESVSVRCSELQ
jgi:serine/threonine protein kinase